MIMPTKRVGGSKTLVHKVSNGPAPVTLLTILTCFTRSFYMVFQVSCYFKDFRSPYYFLKTLLPDVSCFNGNTGARLYITLAINKTAKVMPSACLSIYPGDRRFPDNTEPFIDHRNFLIKVKKFISRYREVSSSLSSPH